MSFPRRACLYPLRVGAKVDGLGWTLFRGGARFNLGIRGDRARGRPCFVSDQRCFACCGVSLCSEFDRGRAISLREFIILIGVFGFSAVIRGGAISSLTTRRGKQLERKNGMPGK